jgi:two-component system sensor histidine kinase MtrB
MHVTVTRQHDQAVIDVADAGPGIPATALPHIFDRQFKADRSRSRRGSGLGLAIARENARLLGGDITATSTPGTGSNFTLRLPVAESLSNGSSPVTHAAEDKGEMHSRQKGRP